MIGISRDNDVTIVSALSPIAALTSISSEMLNATDTLGACLLLCKVSQKLTYKRNFEKSTKRAQNIHELKTGLNADKFAPFFLLFFRNILTPIRSIHDAHALYSRLNASRLARFRKTRKHVNQKIL